MSRCLGIKRNGERCPRLVYVRGLCASCVSQARKRIKSGSATWESLEAAGLALPAETREARGERMFRLVQGRIAP